MHLFKMTVLWLAPIGTFLRATPSGRGFFPHCEVWKEPSNAKRKLWEVGTWKR